MIDSVVGVGDGERFVHERPDLPRLQQPYAHFRFKENV
jgi:hypothetical protein